MGLKTFFFGALASVQEPARRDAQRGGKLLDHCDCWIALPALDLADIGSVNPGLERILLLTPAFRLAQTPHVRSKAKPNIHLENASAVQTLNLQTMSHNPLDCPVALRISAVTDSLQRQRVRETSSIDDIKRRVSDAAFGRPLVTNVLRGLVAEAIVASALEPEWNWCSEDYASWDFERADGLKLEVKQSAARQSWATTGPPSKCRFDIRARKGRWEGQDWVPEPGRNADIYVFAHHPLADGSADHRDPAQWTFYVVEAKRLPDAATMGLSSALVLGVRCSHEELSAVVSETARRFTNNAGLEPDFT